MAEIKNRWNGEVIVSDENKTIRQLCIESYKNLSGASLSNANLRGADLSGADLRGANLSDADLSGADLSGADLRGADLSDADLSDANLSDANLSDANLSDANLSNANLSDANLSNANLSNAKHLLNATEFLSKFQQDALGVIVYKRIGNQTTYSPASHWVIEPGALLTEVPNSDRSNLCGCGVNFATLEWCQKEYRGADIWKCRINWIDLADVCVPYNTDGKARCAKLTLLEIIG